MWSFIPNDNVLVCDDEDVVRNMFEKLTKDDVIFNNYIQCGQMTDKVLKDLKINYQLFTFTGENVYVIENGPSRSEEYSVNAP